MRRGAVAVLLVIAVPALTLWAGREWLRGDTLPAKLTCAEVKDLARAYVLDELDRPLQALIERHLRHCPHCHDHIGAVRNALQDHPQPRGALDGRPPSHEMALLSR